MVYILLPLHAPRRRRRRRLAGAERCSRASQGLINSEYDAMKSTVLTGVDFYSHLVAEDRARRGQPYESSPGHLRVKAIDLAAMLFKATYLDRKNMTFIVRRYERGKRLAAGRRRPGNRPQGANSMVAADGALAELIARKVGKGRAREIHDHGPLVFHL